MDRNSLRTELDEIDRKLIAALTSDGRITNAELASRVGIAPSTAHGRVQSLIQRGVISGFTATVNQAKLGFGLQALVGVTLGAGARQASITDFADHARFSEVVQVFFLGGVDDFMVHVAVADSSALRRFVVENISGHPRVASTRTNIIFDYHRGAVVDSFR